MVEDPTRAIRSDALDMGKIRQAWDALTQPEPNKGRKVMVRCGDGEYAPHVVHWQPEKTKLAVFALHSKRLTHMVTGIPTQYTATGNTSAAQYFYKCLSDN